MASLNGRENSPTPRAAEGCQLTFCRDTRKGKGPSIRGAEGPQLLDGLSLSLGLLHQQGTSWKRCSERPPTHVATVTSDPLALNRCPRPRPLPHSHLAMLRSTVPLSYRAEGSCREQALLPGPNASPKRHLMPSEVPCTGDTDTPITRHLGQVLPINACALPLWGDN